MDNLAFVDGEIYIGDSEISKTEINKINDKIYTFDEALTLSGHGKFQLFLSFICGLCFMAVMIETMGISMVIDQAQCDLKFTIYEKGLLSSVGFFGVVLSSHIMGVIADTCGRVKLLKYALLISLILSIISVFSISVWMLSILRFIVGFFISGCQACVFSFVGEFNCNKKRIRTVTLLSCFLPLGAVFLPAIALIILPLNIEFYIGTLKFTSWRLVLLGYITPSLIGLIGIQFIPESPKFLLIQGKHDEAIDVLQLCYSINTGQNKDNYPVKNITLEITGANFSNIKSVSDALKLIWTQTTPLFNRVRVFHTLNILYLYFVIFTISQGLFMWFPSILNVMVNNIDNNYTVCHTLMAAIDQNLNNTATDSCDTDQAINITIYEYLIGIGAIYTGIHLIFSYIINIVGEKRLLSIWLFICGVATFGLYWCKDFYLNLILFTLTIALGNAGGLINTISIEFYPTNINAMAMCFIMMIGRLGAVVGSNFIGLLITYNCDMSVFIFGGIIIVLVPLSYLLPSKN